MDQSYLRMMMKVRHLDHPYSTSGILKPPIFVYVETQPRVERLRPRGREGSGLVVEKERFMVKVPLFWCLGFVLDPCVGHN